MKLVIHKREPAMELIKDWIFLPLLFTVVLCGAFSVDASVVDNSAELLKPKGFTSKGGPRFRRSNSSLPPVTWNYQTNTAMGGSQVEVCLLGVKVNPEVISNRGVLKYITCRCRHYISMCDSDLVRNQSSTLPVVDDNDPDKSGATSPARQCQNYVHVFINCGRESRNEEIDQTKNRRELCSAYAECPHQTHGNYPFSELEPSITDPPWFLDTLTCCVPEFWTPFPNATWISDNTHPGTTQTTVNSNDRSTISGPETENGFYTTSPVVTVSPTNANWNSTAGNLPENNETTYIIVGVTTSFGFLLIISLAVLLVKRLRRKSPETNSNVSSRLVNLLTWVRGRFAGNVQRESSTALPFFRGNRTEQPKHGTNLASVATNQNPTKVSENNTSSDIQIIQRGDAVDNRSSTTRDNIYTAISNAGGDTNEYSSLDEVSLYGHTYSGILNNDPNDRPAMPLPLHVTNQPTPYYSIAQPHINHPDNQHTEHMASQYVELYDETSAINQPINTTGYLIPIPIAPIVYANTEPHTYISILPTND